VPLDELVNIAGIADAKYRDAKPIIKPDGSIRQPFDALPPLKDIQKRIKSTFLERVIFPDYLTGSLKGKDARRNANLHIGAATVVCEDVEGFFPSTKSGLILSVWEEFFHFSNDVAQLLTLLTTKDGALPQGAVTSSHLANLAFWRHEHSLYLGFFKDDISYSRYVDDITVSSPRKLSNQELTKAIGRIYSMMKASGFKAKRKKQEIQRANGPMRATKLLVNVRAALPHRDRQAIRAAVFQLERNFSLLVPGVNILKEVNSLAGRVGRLTQMHPTEGKMLQLRIAAIKQAISLKA
jgi:hypothetical protein